MFTMLSPIFQLLLLHFITRSNQGLKLAIVNDEIADLRECLNITFNPTFVNGRCKLEKSSCLFLNEIQHNFMKKEFYKTFDEAYENLKAGRAVVLLHVKLNFTDSINLSFEKKHFQDVFAITAKAVDVHIDRTIWRLAENIKVKILAASDKFLRQGLSSCNISNYFLNSLVAFQEPIYGSPTFNRGTFLLNIATVM